MGGAYAKAIEDQLEQDLLTAQVCIDPFHVVKLANEAVDKCRRWAWNEARRSGDGATWVKRTR
jgi:transposase